MAIGMHAIRSDLAPPAARKSNIDDEGDPFMFEFDDYEEEPPPAPAAMARQTSPPQNDISATREPQPLQDDISATIDMQMSSGSGVSSYIIAGDVPARIAGRKIYRRPQLE